MSDDLIERLRFCNEHGIFCASVTSKTASYGEAADRIETQAAEIRSLRAQVAELEAELGYHGIYPNPIVPHDTLADSDGDDGA